MPDSSYRRLEAELRALGSELDPAELHGMLVGYLCAVKTSTRGRRSALYRSWLGPDLPASLAQLLENAYEKAREALDEFADFDFRLMLPGDDERIARRAAAVANWCSGFISGLGEAGSSPDGLLTEEVAEALQDLSRIAALSGDVPDGEGNEADLFQIEEFVRVSTLLIFSETAGPSRH